MTKLSSFFRLEDRSYNQQYKQARKENTRLDSYKIMGL